MATIVDSKEKPASILDLIETIGEGIALAQKYSEELAEKNLHQMGSSVAEALAGLSSETKELLDIHRKELEDISKNISSKQLTLEGEVRSADTRIQKSLDSLSSFFGNSLDSVRSKFDSLSDSTSATVADLRAAIGELSGQMAMVVELVKKMDERVEKHTSDMESRIIWLETKVKLLTRTEKVDKEIEYAGGLPVRIHEQRKFGE